MKNVFSIVLLISVLLISSNVYGFESETSNSFITKPEYSFSIILKLIIAFSMLISMSIYFFRKRNSKHKSEKKLKENISSLRKENIGTVLISPNSKKRITLLNKVSKNNKQLNTHLESQAKKLKVTTGELLLALQIKNAQR